MAKTNFSGPITSGNIRNTTGTTVSTNVRNVGFTEVSQTYPVDYSMFTFDDDSLVTNSWRWSSGNFSRNTYSSSRLRNAEFIRRSLWCSTCIN